MAQHDFPCPICSGQKQIELGNSINNQSSGFVNCPACEGKGYLIAHLNAWSKESKNFWNRLSGYGDFDKPKDN